MRAAHGGLNLARLSQIATGERPDVVLVMAGGYTALKSSVDSLLFANDHFLTLDLAARYGVPALMFPVSIGPIHPAVRRILRRSYRAYHTIFLRDDESVDELDGLSNTLRVPDLAVQTIAEQSPPRDRAESIGEICLIARGLDGGTEGYAENLRTLDVSLRTDFETTWRLQVPKDAEFYERARLRFSREPLKYEVLSSQVSATVSVRLHGALMSILNGVPAIHLSYDRKGSGAYGDLGLDEWLHQAGDFDPGTVAEQARALVASPTRFWQAIDASRPRLMKMIESQSDRIADFWLSVREGTDDYR